MSKKNHCPRFVGANRGYQKNKHCNFTKQNNGRKLNRALLPLPIHYYSTQFPNISTKHEWITVHCCFHSPDKNPSLSINILKGHFLCHACYAKGGDIIAFHQMRYQTNFIETIDYFGAWIYE